MPLAFNLAAIHLSEAAPAAFSSSMIGNSSERRVLALAGRVARLAPRPLSPAAARLPRVPLSFFPLALAAPRATLVHLEIMRRSSSATMAMNPSVSRLAHAMSATTRSTPALSSPNRKCASRQWRSNSAITKVALRRLHRCDASVSLGRSVRLSDF
jgi:hypothetical protein